MHFGRVYVTAWSIVFCLALSGCSSSQAPSDTPILSISVAGAAPSVGSTSQFRATAVLSNGSTQDITSSAAWQSSSPAVAAVTSSGTVSGMNTGDADIRATYRNVTGTLHISVANGAFTLLGVVRQQDTSAPVTAAAIAIIDGANAGRSTSTDGNGYYSLGGMRAGTSTLQATRSGLMPTTRAVDMTGDQRLDFTMAPTAPPPTAGPATPQCNGALWNYVYDASRLQIKAGCQTVTGVITDQHTNDDGDIDVRLEVYAPYRGLLNGGNMSNLSGHLQTEAICQTSITTADAARACQGFHGSIAIPPNGAHVQVTGTYVLDTIHGWMELHPISVLTVIP